MILRSDLITDLRFFKIFFFLSKSTIAVTKANTNICLKLYNQKALRNTGDGELSDLQRAENLGHKNLMSCTISPVTISPPLCVDVNPELLHLDCLMAPVINRPQTTTAVPAQEQWGRGKGMMRTNLRHFLCGDLAHIVLPPFD